MDATNIAQYKNQIVELTFTDGARVKAHILSVDPDAIENHVFFDVLEVHNTGPRPDVWKRTPLGTSAEEIIELRPTGGKPYVKGPGSKSFQKPWWRFW